MTSSSAKSTPDDIANGCIRELDYQFRDPALLTEALTHRSYNNRNNERLEFLGDGVVNMVVADLLYRSRPNVPEGDLSRLRARVVRGDTLADIAQELHLGDYLLLGEGEMKSGGFRRASILADVFEALIGAIYLDRGYQAAYQAVKTITADRIAGLPDAEALKDAKTRLQEWLQAKAYALPVYHLMDESGAEHAKCFTVACAVETDHKASYTARGSSRRRAEQAAAAEALRALGAGEPAPN